MAFFKTKDDVNLYFKDWGAGRPVVLIHGWPLMADSWDDHALAIADAGYRVLAYDRRGFGRSDQPWSGYSYDTLADDLRDLITELKLQDATIIGFSMGGGEVARYMSRHDGKDIAQCSLISSIVPYMLKTSDNPDGVEQSVFDGMAAAIKKDRAGFYGSFFKDFYGVGKSSKPVSDEVLEWTRAMAMRGGLKPTLDCATAFATTDFRDELGSFIKPTLIVHGSGDQTVPIVATGRAAAKGIASSTFKEYDGAPHGLTVTHQEKLKNDLLEFLKS